VPSYGVGGGSFDTNWLGCYFKGKKMWGSVYITSSSWAADFKVYQTSSSWNSDLNVYVTNSSWAANSCGIWYITNSSWAADFTIYLTSSSWNADFKIYLTSNSWRAGRWRSSKEAGVCPIAILRLHASSSPCGWAGFCKHRRPQGCNGLTYLYRHLNNWRGATPA